MVFKQRTIKETVDQETIPLSNNVSTATAPTDPNEDIGDTHVEDVHLILEQNKERIVHFVTQRLDDVFREVEHKIVAIRKDMMYHRQDDDSEDGGPLALSANGSHNGELPVVRPTTANEKAKERAKKGPKAVFADAAAMKEAVREIVKGKTYNVFDFYHETGYAQRIARNPTFESITLGVIAVNAVWVAVDTDYNYADNVVDADLIFQIVENAFCVFFTFEWVTRWLAFERKRNGLKDSWFCFDFMLMFLMVFDTWLLSCVQLTTGFRFANTVNPSFLKIFRMLRLARMARMAKLLRAVPELMILIKGMFVATRSVVFTLALLILVTYFFAVLFVQLTVERDAQGNPDPSNSFNSVLGAMETLLLWGVIPDQGLLVTTVGKGGGLNYFYAGLVVVFILVATLTVMNMLVGVLVEVVSIVSAVEKETIAVNYVKLQLEEMLEYSGVDVNGDRQISRIEFQGFLLNRKAACAMQNVGVDVVGLVDFSDFLFRDGQDEVSFGEFIELVMSLRGSNQATVKDIIDLRKHINKVLFELKDMSSPVAGCRVSVPQAPGIRNVKSLRSKCLEAPPAPKLAPLRPANLPPSSIVMASVAAALSTPRSNSPNSPTRPGWHSLDEAPFEVPPLPSQLPPELDPYEPVQYAVQRTIRKNFPPAGHFELRRAAETGTTGLARRLPDFPDSMWAAEQGDAAKTHPGSPLPPSPNDRSSNGRCKVAPRSRGRSDERIWTTDEP